MRKSAPLPTRAVGMRYGTVQLTPSEEEIITRSLVPMGALQADSNRQSSQTTYTRPDLSISAVGRGPERILPGSPSKRICAARTVLLQLLPPSVERKERIAVSKQSSMGTMTVPLGCTRGCPPMTHALSGVVNAGPHVLPPSVEVLICTWLMLLALSNSV